MPKEKWTNKTKFDIEKEKIQFLQLAVGNAESLQTLKMTRLNKIFQIQLF